MNAVQTERTSANGAGERTTRVPDPQSIKNRLAEFQREPAPAETPQLAWRLASWLLLGNLDHPLQGPGYTYPPATFRVDLCADSSMEDLRAHIAQRIVDATRSPLLAAGQDYLANSQDAAKLDKLVSDLAAAQDSARTAHKEAADSLGRARRALADGSDPAEHESAYVDATNRQRVFENRCSAFRELIATARSALGAGLRRAVEAKRGELLAAARVKADLCIAETLTWIQERLVRNALAFAAVHDLDPSLSRVRVRDVVDDAVGALRGDL
jgi:hypothetical protein